MADYVGYERSNYFKVKDVEKFRAFCRRFNLEMWQGKDGCVGFCDNENYGTIRMMYNAKTEEDEEIDMMKELSKELAPGEVAVYQEIGHEKMRYLCGYSVAVNSKGKSVVVSIDDIYDKARSLAGKRKKIAYCSY